MRCVPGIVDVECEARVRLPQLLSLARIRKHVTTNIKRQMPTSEKTTLSTFSGSTPGGQLTSFWIIQSDSGTAPIPAYSLAANMLRERLRILSRQSGCSNVGVRATAAGSSDSKGCSD